MLSCSRKWSGWTLPFVLVLAVCLPVHGYSPALILGVYGEGLSTADGSGEAAVRASGLLSWRRLLAERASLAFYASSILDRTVADSQELYDSHTLSINALVQSPAGFLFWESGLSGSLTGTLEGQSRYVRPDWRIGYEGQREDLRASVTYKGYYFNQPETNEDSLFQGLTLALEAYPSIRIRYGIEILGGWERWPEWFLYAAGGGQTDENRDDFLGSVKASAGGLIGYFHDWSIAAEGGVRWSDANRLIAPLPVEEGSESYIFFAVDGDWAWSPHRQVSLEIGAFVRQDLYIQRDALTELGAPSGVPLRVFSAGADLRGDWTPNDRLFLVLEVSASRRFANEPGESWWNLLGRAGIEFGF
jgi:hypothetical protein